MKKVPVKLPKFSLIAWVDITDHPGWNQVDSIGEQAPLSCFTVGFILKKTKDFIWVSDTVSYGGHSESGEMDRCGTVSVIPVGCIVSIKEMSK